MHIISRKKLRQFSRKHADAGNALNTWYKIASKAQWKNLAEVQGVYSQAEAVTLCMRSYLIAPVSLWFKKD